MKDLNNNPCGYQIFSREELRKIKGGDGGFTSGRCSMTYTTPSNPNPQTVFYTLSGSCSQQSSSMNTMCVNNITVGLFVTCGYNCECDD